MSDKPSTAVPVHLLDFRRAVASDDGQAVLFEAADTAGKTIHIEVRWENLSLLAHMLNQAGVDAAQRREAAGISGEFTGVGAAQIVSGFHISDAPDRKMKLLSLHSPSGLRCDFALGVEARDKEGRTLTNAIAEGLIR